MGETLVRVQIDPGSVPFASARNEIETSAITLSGDPESTWVISQSLADDIHFEFFTGSLPENFERSIAGRVFGPKGELRWLREGGLCKTWKIQEVAADGSAFRKRERRYYLWGMYDGATYSENRTDRKFKYPAPSSVKPQRDERAYILVAEYLAVPPETWPHEEDPLETVLNQPEIVAHRYLNVNVGTGFEGDSA